MNSRSLLRRPTGPQAGILRCHVMNSRALLRKTQEVPKTPGAFLVHFWCTLGALMVHFSLLVHFWCTPGALLVHSRCTFGALLVHSRCTPKVSRKGIASLPKGSLDPPHRNVWIAFSSLTNPKGNCTASERKPRSSAQKRLDLANLQTRKGIAPLPKGSLDPPHRNVWIALCKGTGK